jgi:glucosamine--fructose-6-phosphate aminotransferase (isomerizing)
MRSASDLPESCGKSSLDARRLLLIASMCGIVGYVGGRPCRDLLVAGLEKLEYRGYDSAGVSVIEDGRVESVRSVGNLANLRAAMDVRAADGGGVAVAAPPATTGVAHTRWATHGRVTEENAHPHSDSSDRVHIVLNGIIENHAKLRRRLERRGQQFSSETDAEVVAHLIATHYRGDLADAVRASFAELRGHYAFVAMHADQPGMLVGARQECPLVAGVGEGESFLASAIPAFLAETRRAVAIENGEVVTIDASGVSISDAEGNPVERQPEEVSWDEAAAEKGGYETFMLKEIYEQADAVAETIADRLPTDESVDLSETGLDDDFLRSLRRIVIVACGTSYHAGLVGRYAIEEWARVPVEMDIASEFRYRNPVIGPDDLVIGITQSGETADTLAAMRLARENGAKVLAITNIMGSQATRDADAILYTRAGLEIGVAATKTFVAQVATMYLLGLRLSELRGTLDSARLRELIVAVKSLPSKIEATLASCKERVDEISAAYAERQFFLYLGRHIGLPVCLEGALKLKEVSYVPTDAYAAGEMKHGPIALLDESTPVVAVATESPVLAKVLSNVEEVRARGAETIAIATEGCQRVGEVADETIEVARTDWILQPIVAILPLQLLAYDIARARGLNVDQPRNLAKTVTVE